MHKESESSSPTVSYGTLSLDGLGIASREGGSFGSLKVVLLHGFPASSHQYRNLFPALASRFHVISPDHPGFGNSDLPDPAKFSSAFDRLSEITESLATAQSLAGSWQ
jgi:pimeloyl-ACP methyl ester carboxylesterase